MKMRKLACRLIATPRHTMHSETEHHTMGQTEAYTCATDNGAGSKTDCVDKCELSRRN
jgi:hypothetical protein